MGRVSTALVFAGGDGQAGIGDAFRGILHGAKEALRQATYWQMKNRAGVVGQRGLGPLLGRLDATRVRVHLVGHSFGARLVSFALAGLPSGPSPVRAVSQVAASGVRPPRMLQPMLLPIASAVQRMLAGVASTISAPCTPN